MHQQREYTQTDWDIFLTGETLVASLLSKVLYAYPEKAWLQSLADEDVFTEAPLGNPQPDVQRGLALLQGWARTERGGMSSETFDALRADYTRLLLGAGKVLAPPWESVYFSEDRLVFQEQTLQVRAWYLRFGLEAENRHQEPDDHIGLQLAFVAHLARQALIALDNGDQTKFEYTLAAQREFLSKHLLRWASQWCKLVQSHAHTDFFRGIALLTKGILAEIVAVLQIEAISEVTL